MEFTYTELRQLYKQFGKIAQELADKDDYDDPVSPREAVTKVFIELAKDSHWTAMDFLEQKPITHDKLGWIKNTWLHQQKTKYGMRLIFEREDKDESENEL